MTNSVTHNDSTAINSTNSLNNNTGSNSFSIMNMLRGIFHRTHSVAIEQDSGASHPMQSDSIPANPPEIDTPTSLEKIQDNAYLLEQCSHQVKEYVKIVLTRESVSDKIKALNLTTEEERLFDEFLDPIFLEYMNIPVCLNEQYFDISTLSKCKMIDPLTNEDYHPLSIQPARKLLDRLDTVIIQLKNNRVDETVRQLLALKRKSESKDGTDVLEVLDISSDESDKALIELAESPIRIRKKSRKAAASTQKSEQAEPSFPLEDIRPTSPKL